MHLLKQGAKATAQRKERKQFGALPIDTFFDQEWEEEKKEEEPEEMAGVFYSDPQTQLRQSKRNKGQAPPK